MSDNGKDETVDPKLFAVLFIGIVIGYFVAGGSIMPGQERTEPGNNFIGDGDGPGSTGGAGGNFAVPDECSDVSEVKKDMCIANFAIENDNVSFCRGISSAGAKNFCRGYIRRNRTLCESVDDEVLRKNCLDHVTGDVEETSYDEIPETCEGVEEKKMDMCIANTAINSSDKSLCSEPLNEGVRNYCYGMLTGNLTRCEEVDDEFLRQRCLDSSEG